MRSVQSRRAAMYWTIRVACALLVAAAIVVGLWRMDFIGLPFLRRSGPDWPTYRHDTRLSGHSPAKMNVRSPQVKWEIHLGTQVGLIVAKDVASASGLGLLALEGGTAACYTAYGERIWQSANLVLRDIIGVYDLDEDGRREIVATALPADVVILSGEDGSVLWQYRLPDAGSAITYSGIKVGKVASSERGLQIVAWPPKTNVGRVFTFSEGVSSGRELITLDARNPEGDDVQYPILTLVDVDGDAKLEIATPGWGHVFVFDGETGLQKGTVAWASGGLHKRNYGHFAWSDVDGDGLPEGLLLADGIIKHFAMIENETGALSLLWDHLYEAIYDHAGDRIEPRPVMNSVADVTGDSRPDIVVGMFDATGDGAWHTLVIDPLIGPSEPVLDLPGKYLWAVEDTDGDAFPELLLSDESTRVAGSLSTLTVMALAGSEWTEIWSAPSSHYVEQTHRDYAAEVNSISYHARQDVWVVDLDRDGGSELFIRQDSDGDYVADRLVVWSFSGPQPHVLWEKPLADAGGRLLEVADLTGNGYLELVLDAGNGEVAVSSASGESLARFPVGGFGGVAPVVSDLDQDGQPEVIAPTAAGTIAAFHVEDGEASLQWEIPGYGRAIYGLDRSVAAVDLDGDELREVLIGQTEDDAPILTALDSRGQPVWQRPFPGFPAGNSSSRGLYEWTTGKLGTDAGIGIYVALARNGFASQESFVLMGADGQEVWHKTNVGGATFGPLGCAASYDMDDDGSDEFLIMAKNILTGASAATGRMPTLPRPVDVGPPPGGFVGYGSPIVSDVDGDGVSELVLAGNYGGQGLYDIDFMPRWWVDAYEFDVMGRLPGLADVDGDGKLEMAVGFSAGDLIAYDATTGAEEWKLTVGAVTTDIISADVDADDRPEFVFATQDGRLYAAEGSSQRGGALLWQLDLGFELSSPIIADADGDGRAEILLVAGNGVLYAVE